MGGPVIKEVFDSSRKKIYHDLSMNSRMMNVDQLSAKVALTPNIPHALWPASKQHHDN
jgi:hypothetical protein